ncbi:hypothetical protein CASFOL_027890 [Castilleja foliolosa]|uniref:Uncharacterized protein n=1 Tax=Castilleja foliolosa TaxID=1961234 RepID=A0ABD3CH44_9LAMI
MADENPPEFVHSTSSDESPEPGSSGTVVPETPPSAPPAADGGGSESSCGDPPAHGDCKAIIHISWDVTVHQVHTHVNNFGDLRFFEYNYELESNEVSTVKVIYETAEMKNNLLASEFDLTDEMVKHGAGCRTGFRTADLR